MRQREMSARIGSRITEIAVGAQLQFTGRRLILAGRDDGPRPLARHIVVDFVGSFARQFGKSEARRSACGSRFGALHAVDPYPVVGAPQKRNRRAVDGAADVRVEEPDTPVNSTARPPRTAPASSSNSEEQAASSNPHKKGK